MIAREERSRHRSTLRAGGLFPLALITICLLALVGCSGDDDDDDSATIDPEAATTAQTELRDAVQGALGNWATQVKKPEFIAAVETPGSPTEAITQANVQSGVRANLCEALTTFNDSLGGISEDERSGLIRKGTEYAKQSLADAATRIVLEFALAASPEERDRLLTAFGVQGVAADGTDPLVGVAALQGAGWVDANGQLALPETPLQLPDEDTDDYDRFQAWLDGAPGLSKSFGLTAGVDLDDCSNA